MTGGINGSSPWMFTIISSSAIPSLVTTSAKRSVPELCASDVIHTSAPKAFAAFSTCSLSVAIITRLAPDC